MNKLIYISAFCIGLVLAYWIGYKEAANRERRANLAFNIQNSVHLYAVLQNGDSKKMTNDLQMLIYAYVDSYKRLVGGDHFPEMTNEYFLRAISISDSFKSNMITFTPSQLKDQVNGIGASSNGTLSNHK